jgi:hypothetical protein
MTVSCIPGSQKEEESSDLAWMIIECSLLRCAAYVILVSSAFVFIIPPCVASEEVYTA